MVDRKPIIPGRIVDRSKERNPMINNNNYKSENMHFFGETQIPACEKLRLQREVFSKFELAVKIANDEEPPKNWSCDYRYRNEYEEAKGRQVLSVRYCGNVVVEFIEDCNNEIVVACRDEYYLKRSSHIEAFIDALKGFKGGN